MSASFVTLSGAFCCFRRTEVHSQSAVVTDPSLEGIYLHIRSAPQVVAAGAQSPPTVLDDPSSEKDMSPSPSAFSIDGAGELVLSTSMSPDSQCCGTFGDSVVDSQSSGSVLFSSGPPPGCGASSCLVHLEAKTKT